MTQLTLTVIAAIIYLSSLADVPRQLELGPFSGLGMLTAGYACVTWTLWVLRPMVNKILWRSTFLLGAFLAWGYLSLVWCPSFNRGLQNLAVMAAFLGAVLISARESYRSRAFAARIPRFIRWSTVVTTALFASGLVCAAAGTGAMLVGARAFALFALLCVALLLSAWRYGQRGALFWAIVITALMGLSLSRMAFMAALIMFPLAQRPSRGLRESVRLAVWLGVVTAVGYSAVTRVAPLHDRFFKGDLSLRLGDLSLNASGRTAFWKATIDSYAQSPFIGRGAGSSEVLMQATFTDIGHPHNDYLRVLHDYGLVGLALWLSAVATLAWRIGREFVRADRLHLPEASLHLSALLVLAAVALTMASDNALVYVFVMGPAGALIGASLGAACRPRTYIARMGSPGASWYARGLPQT